MSEKKIKVVPAEETIAHLLSQYDYDKLNGQLIWAKSTKTTEKGDVAGSIDGRGYRQVRCWLKLELAHRMIWLIEKGSLPNLIDHIDGNRLNNRIENLRETTPRQNASNTAKHRDGALPGANFQSRLKQNPWHSKCKINGKTTHIGYFKTKSEAHEAYTKFLKEAE